MVNLRQEAMRYLEKGWSVIPAQPKGKKPLIRWERYVSQLPTPEEIDAWWTRWPDANIAIVTGKVSGLVVVDVDVDRGGQPSQIYNKTPTGMISRTGSGGFHLFYTHPNGANNITNKVGQNGIDIRGDGGYVIAAPSMHANGNTYEWVRYGKPGVFPRWLNEETSSVEVSNGEKWLLRLLQGQEKGSRNNACARLSGYLASKGMAKDVTRFILREWNARNKPPLPSTELSTIVDSVYRTEWRRNGAIPANAVSANPTQLSVMNFQSYMSKFGSANINWCIGDWLPESTIAFVVSPPGTYKTWMVLDLAVSVAGGFPFLGLYDVSSSGPVLVMQQEDFHGQIVERIASIVASRQQLVFNNQDDDMFECPNAPDLPIFFHPDRALRFEDRVVMASFEDLVEKLRPKLVIIDPLYSAGNVDDYMAKTAEQMFPLKRMRDKYNTSFLVVHHTSKKAENNGREAAWGSQFLNAFLETGWQIRPTSDENSVTVHRHFKVKGSVPSLCVNFDIQTDKPPYHYDVACEDADEVLNEQREKKKNDVAIEKAGDDIFTLLKKEPLTATQIAQALDVHRSTASRRLTQLVKAGVLKKRQNKYELVLDLPSF